MTLESMQQQQQQDKSEPRNCHTKESNKLPDTRHLTEDQRKYQCVFNGLMAPSGEALKHLAAPMLLDFARHGCPVDTGPSWTQAQIEAALKKGAHPLAMDPAAAKQLRGKSIEKADKGFCWLVNWNDIKADPHKNLKISSIAAIPHKSHDFQ
jgi:hypothetical protein